MNASTPPPENPVAAYKTLFRDALDRRPSGMRQRLAEALGKNRSFITQISNPAYPTPIPAEHVDRIMELCHFSPDERRAFLDAYRIAHARRTRQIANGADTRTLILEAPEFGDAAKNAAYDQTMRDIARRIAKLVRDAGPASPVDEDGNR